jgi:hypothetical protein
MGVFREDFVIITRKKERRCPCCGLIGYLMNMPAGMKTNHLMLKELLEKYRPKERGILNHDEYELIKKTLCLEGMDILALRNLRDYTVTSLSKHEAKMEDWDKMSAITHCIDIQIAKLGGEV